MTVYIDVLIILNIYITYFILKSAARLFHIGYKFRRLALASVIGGAASVLAVIDAGFILSLIIKAAATSVIVFSAFGFGEIKKFIRNVFVCISLGMLLSGLASLLHEISGSDFIFSAGGYVYIEVSAFMLVVSSTAVYGIMSVLRRFLDSPVSDGKVKLIIRNGGRSAEISALKDSGNCLCDFLTGLPVVLCAEERIKPVLPENIVNYLGGNTDDMKGVRIIPMRTAGGEGIVAAFRPDGITADINGTEKEITALIGVRKGALSGESFDAVISPRLLI